MLPPFSQRTGAVSYSTVRSHAIYLHFNSLIYPKDLYGRGYSDAPQTTYDTNLYTTQLAHLMQYLRWEKANIVGVSMVRS
jgi:pimeloyl-ACP methyl ester carboxylesterase